MCCQGCEPRFLGFFRVLPGLRASVFRVFRVLPGLRAPVPAADVSGDAASNWRGDQRSCLRYCLKQTMVTFSPCLL